MNLKQWFGLLRSRAMYYWKPFNKRRLMRFYGQFIDEGDLCFDIGAHLGNRTDAWVGLGARVIAVDPQPVCIDFLSRKFGQMESVVVVPKAVAANPGHITLHVSHATPTVSTASDIEWRKTMNANAWYEVKWEDEVQVESITLDQLISVHGTPKFCKIDVENYEAEVIRGLSTPIPILSFEYFPPRKEKALECFELLSALGEYEYNWSFGESQKLNSRNWLDNASMLRIIQSYSTHSEYGDIYARLII